MRFYIYKIDCHASGKSYIGCTTNLKGRLAQHRSRGWLPMDEGSNDYILACCWEKASAGQLEAAMILQHDTLHPNGHNQAYGGFDGRRFPQAVRDAISAAAEGRASSWLGRKHSEQTKAKMREQRKALAAQGKWGGSKGRVLSDETKAKMRAAKLGKPNKRKGIKRTDEERAAIALGRANGKKRQPPVLTEAQRQRLRELRKNQVLTEETRLKMRYCRTKESRSASSKKAWETRRAKTGLTLSPEPSLSP